MCATIFSALLLPLVEGSLLCTCILYKITLKQNMFTLSYNTLGTFKLNCINNVR